ncbi:hypothetical protein ES319_A11G020600v1 [Gossypium barbadense]|uniref:Uncharacterized protein n=2 Tax=Gossypium TaxID=3633 RepID=A0A5J5THL4_GOSBA|nr:hypothetical protein ES319_A11G020600v1 [Gossypium barbadense]TYG92320.1 hypothetical protein ES288_A11G020600v1 [Gossypium darwinii]
MDRFTITNITGKVIIVGVVISISGLMIVHFYAGSEIHLWSTDINFLPKLKVKPSTFPVPKQHLGIVFAYCSCLCNATVSVLLDWMRTRYNYPVLSASLFMCGSSAMLSAIYALVSKRTSSAWQFHLDINHDEAQTSPEIVEEDGGGDHDEVPPPPELVPPPAPSVGPSQAAPFSAKTVILLDSITIMLVGLGLRLIMS